MMRFITLFSISIFLPSSASWADDAPIKPAANSDKEPMAERFSLERGAQFLDAVSVDWTRQRKCGTCHTNYAHMMAGPLVKPSAEMAEVRAFFEARAAGWDKAEKAAKPIADGEIVATAAALAFNDAASTGKLHPLTRAALDRMWTVQRPDGGWKWFDCNLPPMEDDDYYGIALAAVAVGHAPDDYKSGESAQKGLEKIRGYLQVTPVPNLHHKALLMWASMGLEGLMDKAEREKTVAELLSKQRPDGGWSLNSLGHFDRRDGTSNTEDSDGYGTGFVVYVLRQSGMPRGRRANSSRNRVAKDPSASLRQMVHSLANAGPRPPHYPRGHGLRLDGSDGMRGEVRSCSTNTCDSARDSTWSSAMSTRKPRR